MKESFTPNQVKNYEQRKSVKRQDRSTSLIREQRFKMGTQTQDSFNTGYKNTRQHFILANLLSRCHLRSMCLCTFQEMQADLKNGTNPNSKLEAWSSVKFYLADRAHTPKSSIAASQNMKLLSPWGKRKWSISQESSNTEHKHRVKTEKYYL